MGTQQQGADATEGRWLVIPRTLSFLRHGDDVLLMKRGAHKRVFPNQYNGLGGHIERDEDPMTSALREIHEECGLAVTNVRLRAVHHIDAGATTGILLFIFTADALSRDFVDTGEEGTLHWVSLADLTQYDLVDDILILLPAIFEMDPAAPVRSGHVYYDERDTIQIDYAGR